MTKIEEMTEFIFKNKDRIRNYIDLSLYCKEWKESWYETLIKHSCYFEKVIERAREGYHSGSNEITKLLIDDAIYRSVREGIKESETLKEIENLLERARQKEIEQRLRPA